MNGGLKMKNKILNKSIAIFLLLTILLSSISNLVLAQTPTEAYIVEKGQCERHLMHYNAEKQAWTYIICTMVVYRENGKEYPAYCLNRELPRSWRGRCIYC